MLNRPDGFALAVKTAGRPSAKRPLVLVHGFSGSAHDFALVMDELASDRMVVAFDHRGHGESTNTGNRADYNIDVLVADTVAVIEEVAASGGGPVHLLGHSMGGRVVQQLTLERPDLVASLIPMDTTAAAFGDAIPEVFREAMLAFFASDAGLASLGALDVAGPETALVDASTSADWRARKAEMSAGFDPAAAGALGLAIFGKDMASLVGRLGEIAVPTTVVVGAGDAFVEASRVMVDAFADAILEIIDGAFHSPQLSHRDEWLAIIAGHLARSGD